MDIGDSIEIDDVDVPPRRKRSRANGGQKRPGGAPENAPERPTRSNGRNGGRASELRALLGGMRRLRDGDFSVRLDPGTDGVMAEIADAFNDMAARNEHLADDVTRVSERIGGRGQMEERIDVGSHVGGWRSIASRVNTLVTDLVAPTMEVARVLTAVAEGDLSEKMALEMEGKPVQGEFLRIGTTVNTMVDQLSSFASEVTRVAREVGTEGKLGGQASVPGVAGTWKDLTDNVNAMAFNLTAQVRNIADVTTAVARGDLSRKITVDARGEILELKNTINTMVGQLNGFASEVTRVAREVGTEGRLGGQAMVPGVAGTWKDLTDSVNAMASNLTSQVRNIATVTTAVARGDLSRKITVDVKGEILELKNTINTMVDQLGAFASEVTRVAREVGTEGQLGGQANVPGVAGTWKDLTDNVNAMAGNLTSQVRNIAEVTTAVARGDLSQKITVEVRGEILELKNTINAMVDSLRVFADEVTRVAKEVGTEGILGGQAEVPGAAGTWRALTDNVNAMANSLTIQVRAIADVATAVTTGDLSRQITVDAQGELDELKNNLNQMIANLKGTTERNAEQDWLKTNLARFSQMMQGQKDLKTVSSMIMSELTPLVSAHHGAFFLSDEDDRTLRMIASYAYKERKHLANAFREGEGLVGQAALEKKPILLTNVPDDYVKITSGLGEAPPRNILVLPVLFEGEVKAVLEIATFQPFSQIHQTFLEQLADSIGVVLNVIGANMRTSELLEQSQSLTQELQSQSEELKRQQEELKRSNTELEAQARTLRKSEELLKDQQEELQQVNEELEEKASLLAEQNRKVEQKNAEVEAARVALEEKASQLALSSRYKSEFLANMSHELRTPLNSLLILARLLAENKDGNLTDKQVEFAQTILSAGTDLLNLINDVLDLSKVEAGKMEIAPVEVPVGEIRDFVERGFRPLADQKGLSLEFNVQPNAPSNVITDPQRLQQVLKNLVGNAIKFTEEGGVTISVYRAEPGRKYSHPQLLDADSVVAFSVTDTGIGISPDKQRLIFEAFQQADGTTSRRFGGTGLGLSISREIAQLLGGEITVESEPGRGSTFTLFVPAVYEGMADDVAPGPIQTARPSERRRRPQTLRQPESSIPATANETAGERRPAATSGVVPDDRADIQPGDRVVLVVENDERFARVLLDRAREKGFKGVIELDGEAGVAAAHDFHPDAITLDIDMPGVDGWAVLERLKHHPDTRHIPVHIISGLGETRQQGLRAGAIAYLEKPVSVEGLEAAFSRLTEFLDKSEDRNLLVVEDDEGQRRAIVDLIAAEDVSITAVSSAEEALRALEDTHFDCMVLDLGLRDMSGFELLERVKADPERRDLPIIIYTGRELSREEETRLRKYAETIIVKDVKSPERLLDETALFLHRVESRLPEQKRQMLRQLHTTDAVVAGKRVLVVDDDVRNIYSIASLLESHGMQVTFAENGREALSRLEEDPGIDAIVMDVMMPEMDGYETTTRIRQDPRYKALPIIALTAKAMKGDREKCIAAGASDYITKPVEPDQLLSLLRVWLYR